MLFKALIIVLALVIVGLCLVAIVMSTSHGSEWVQDQWEKRQGDDG